MAKCKKTHKLQEHQKILLKKYGTYNKAVIFAQIDAIAERGPFLYREVQMYDQPPFTKIDEGINGTD